MEKNRHASLPVFGSSATICPRQPLSALKPNDTRPAEYKGAPEITCPLSRGLSPTYWFHTSSPVLSRSAMARASDMPTNTRPSATATPSLAGDEVGAPPPPRPAPGAGRAPYRQTVLPVFASSAYTNGGAVKNIRPFFTTGIARDEAAASSFSDIHAAPSRVTFCGVICASGEYRMLPAAPVTVGQSRLPVASLRDWTETTTGATSTAATATTALERMINLMAHTLDETRR